MKLRESIIEAINANFAHSVMERNAKAVCKVFNSMVKDSNNMHVFLHIPTLSLTNIDELHDKLTLCFDDCEIEGIIRWRPCTYVKDSFILMSVE